MEKLLPIGTIVTVAEGTVDVEIVGYGGLGKEEIYDYVGFIYPFGFIGRDNILLFNKDKIVKIVHQGYVDDSYEPYVEAVAEKIEESRRNK